MKRLPQTRRWWQRQSMWKKIALGVVVFVGCSTLFLVHANKKAQTVETVRRQTLVQSISTIGSVVSSVDLSLAFQESKPVASVSVRAGQKVTKGTILATLSHGTEQAALASAKSALTKARATYNKVLVGSANQEIQLAQANLLKTKTAQDLLVATALHNLDSDDLAAEPVGTTIDMAPIISGTYSGSQDGQYTISFLNSTTTAEYSGLEKGSVAVSVTPKPLGTKGLLIAFPGSSYTATSSWTVAIPNKSSEQYTDGLSAYQSALATRTKAIAQAQAQLDLTRATARQPDIDAALADVVTAQAAVDTRTTALENTILRAPADGTVTAINTKIGEVPPATAMVFRDVSNLYLEANVSDIKSLAIGQSVTVNFDAFSGETYHASIASIDPTATVVDNVTTYGIKALLGDTDGVKPGMTAQMTIQTAQLPDVLVLPSRAIQTKNGQSTVLLFLDDQNRKTKEQLITVGLQGDNDLVEVQSGLVEGNRVLVNTK